MQSPLVAAVLGLAFSFAASRARAEETAAPTPPAAPAPPAAPTPPVAPTPRAAPSAPAPPAAEDEAGLSEDPMPPPGYVPGHQARVGLGLSPHVPGQPSILPSGIMPSFGAPLRPTDGGKFDFHGHVQAGGRASFNSRQANASHGSLALHGDPIVPRGNVFENTNSVPYTWSELRFTYSTPSVTSNVTLGAWAQSESMQASGSFMPNAQLWVRDAYLSYQPNKLEPVKLNINVGTFEDRYGWMEQYGAGAYGAPVIASIFGVGETIQADLQLGSDFKLQLEHGIKTDLTRPPPDISTGSDNNWAKPWEGSTFVHHGHVGLDYKGIVNPAFHYIQAFSRDDQQDAVPLGNLRAGFQDFVGSTPASYPAYDHGDGKLRILAVDTRFQLRRFGYLYLGVSSTSVENVRSITDIVQIQNAGGGRDLMDRYFGRNNARGRGSLLLAGGEWQVSLGELLRYPDEYWGEGPDVRVSVFGMYGHIDSDDPARDGEDKWKAGIEGTYSVLPWLAAAGRVDRSVAYAHPPNWRNFQDPANRPAGTPPLDPRPSDPLCEFRGTADTGGSYRCFLYKGQSDNTFTVLTAKLIFRSDWTAREALTVQYSRYFYRQGTVLVDENGVRQRIGGFHLITLNSGGQVSSQTDQPDQDLIAVYGTLWW